MAKRLSELPKRKDDPNKWADFWELRCLASIEKAFSADDLLNLIYDNTISEKEETSSGVYEGSRKGEKEDARRAEIDMWLELLRNRATLFGGSLPFHLTASGITLRKNLKAAHRTYLGLLLASNLDYLRDSNFDLTNWFEEFSVEMTKGLLPENRMAKCFRFGKGRVGEMGRYQGNVRKKLEQLGDDLHLSFRTDFERNCLKDSTFLPSKSSGDKGLDIVAWIDFGDRESQKPMFFGQCACGKDWKDKQFEAHQVVWQDIYQFSNRPVTLLFIPHSFRDSNGEFRLRAITHELVLLDRYRLLFLAAKRKPVNRYLHPVVWKAVNSIIEMKLVYWD